MKNFYFTYGSSKNFPFQYGWTMVEAEDMKNAIKIFRKYHPDKMEDTINCADYYTEDEFLKTSMPIEGNGGVFCHETLKDKLTGIPKLIKKPIDAICYRFCIEGVCDPMYIANTIANSLDMGDGCGNFTYWSDKWPEGTDFEKPAKALASTYGCNISGGDIPELMEIIKDGDICLEKAIAGLNVFIKDLKD